MEAGQHLVPPDLAWSSRAAHHSPGPCGAGCSQAPLQVAWVPKGVLGRGLVPRRPHLPPQASLTHSGESLPGTRVGLAGWVCQDTGVHRGRGLVQTCTCSREPAVYQLHYCISCSEPQTPGFSPALRMGCGAQLRARREGTWMPGVSGENRGVGAQMPVLGAGGHLRWAQGG